MKTLRRLRRLRRYESFEPHNNMSELKKWNGFENECEVGGCVLNGIWFSIIFFFVGVKKKSKLFKLVLE